MQGQSAPGLDILPRPPYDESSIPEEPRQQYVREAMSLSQSIQTRLSGLDVLRNVSMLMVVLLHVCGAGGLLAALPDLH